MNVRAPSWIYSRGSLYFIAMESIEHINTTITGFEYPRSLRCICKEPRLPLLRIRIQSDDYLHYAGVFLLITMSLLTPGW